MGLMRHHVVQVSRRVLYVNVTATLGVNVPPNASPDDVRSALDVTNLSADDPIAMLAANPDKFFGRTTKVCPCFMSAKSSMMAITPQAAMLKRSACAAAACAHPHEAISLHDAVPAIII